LQTRKGELSNTVEDLRNLRERKESLEAQVARLDSVEDELADVESMCEALRTELRRENVHYLERVLNELFDELYQSDSYERIELSEEYHLTVHEKKAGRR